MRRVHGRDTTPELVFRRALHARGLRYRVCVDELPGKPDIVLPRRRLAVFIDGDFWHGGQWQTRGLRRLEQQFARTDSRDYWLRKIRRTMQRDAASTASLLAAGWTVLRFWESDIRNALDACVEMTVAALTPQDNARPQPPIAEKTVALCSPRADLLRRGLEPHGWRVVYSVPEGEDRRGALCEIETAHLPPMTLAIAPLSGEERSYERLLGAARETQASGPPLVLIECGVESLSEDQGNDLCLALRDLNDLGYAVDAFVCNGGSEPHGRRRLFVVGAQSAVTRAGGLQERRGAYSLAGDGPDPRPAALTEFILTHPEIGWSPRALPQPPGDDAASPSGESGAGYIETIEWIAMNYLNPLVNELLRGQPLFPAGGATHTPA